jgi:hypothetical protein
LPFKHWLKEMAKSPKHKGHIKAFVNRLFNKAKSYELLNFHEDPISLVEVRGSPLDMDVERSRRLAPLLVNLEMPKAGYHAFRHFNVSMMDALRVPLKTIQERIGHALTGSFTLDVYGHTLD